MTDMLRMAALQIRDPVPELILMETDNPALHGSSAAFPVILPPCTALTMSLPLNAGAAVAGVLIAQPPPLRGEGRCELRE